MEPNTITVIIIGIIAGIIAGSTGLAAAGDIFWYNKRPSNHFRYHIIHIVTAYCYFWCVGLS